MPKARTNDNITLLRERVSNLNDRIASLEAGLKRTQELVQKDMQMLVEMVKKENQ